VTDTPSAGEVTRLLREWKEHGSADAEAALFALIERELIKVANRVLHDHPDRAAKIDPRELVNEAYLALRVYPVATVNRRPFFRLMATAMRHFLLDLVAHDRAAKRPPSSLRVLDSRAVRAVPGDDGVPVLEWYQAIDALRKVEPRQPEVIEMRIVGLTNEEIALELGISHASVKRDLKQARAFLTFQLGLRSPSQEL
jgi:RNA polymerase sigma factor (TIGR02999 family)